MDKPYAGGTNVRCLEKELEWLTFESTIAFFPFNKRDGVECNNDGGLYRRLVGYFHTYRKVILFVRFSYLFTVCCDM